MSDLRDRLSKPQGKHRPISLLLPRCLLCCDSCEYLAGGRAVKQKTKTSKVVLVWISVPFTNLVCNQWNSGMECRGVKRYLEIQRYIPQYLHHCTKTNKQKIPEKKKNKPKPTPPPPQLNSTYSPNSTQVNPTNRAGYLQGLVTGRKFPLHSKQVFHAIHLPSCLIFCSVQMHVMWDFSDGKPRIARAPVFAHHPAPLFTAMVINS